MALKDTVCHKCYLRDAKNGSPYLMSADNEMDPGPVSDHLPQLTQIEEMIIARSHVQMVLFRYRGHQYYYSGHCVSFMQNIVKTVDVLPNLPKDLDVVLVCPSGAGRNPRSLSTLVLFAGRTDVYIGTSGSLRQTFASVNDIY